MSLLLELLNIESQIRTVRESQIAKICQGLAEALAATNDFAGLLRLGVLQDTQCPLGFYIVLIVSHHLNFNCILSEGYAVILSYTTTTLVEATALEIGHRAASLLQSRAGMQDRDIPILEKEQCVCIAASSFRIKSHTVWYECNMRNYICILRTIACLNYIRVIQRTV